MTSALKLFQVRALKRPAVRKAYDELDKEAAIANETGVSRAHRNALKIENQTPEFQGKLAPS
jgi:hypothetical protein